MTEVLLTSTNVGTGAYGHWFTLTVQEGGTAQTFPLLANGGKRLPVPKHSVAEVTEPGKYFALRGTTRTGDPCYFLQRPKGKRTAPRALSSGSAVPSPQAQSLLPRPPLPPGQRELPGPQPPRQSPRAHSASSELRMPSPKVSPSRQGTPQPQPSMPRRSPAPGR